MATEFFVSAGKGTTKNATFPYFATLQHSVWYDFFCYLCTAFQKGGALINYYRDREFLFLASCSFREQSERSIT